MPVRKQKKSGDYDEPQRDRDQLRPGKKCHRIPDQPNDRERSHSSKAVVSGGGFMLLTLQSDKERQEENQEDLHSLRRQRPIEFHYGRFSKRLLNARPDTL